jgi:hypothetical protein
MVAHHMTEPAADPVAFDRVSAAATDRVGHSGRAGLCRAAAAQHEWASPHAASRGESTKGAWVTDSPDQAESRVRPFARRFFSNARPARVCMRWRNPCFLLRRRLLGWNVRFTHGLLGPRVSAQGLGARRPGAAAQTTQSTAVAKARAIRGRARPWFATPVCTSPGSSCCFPEAGDTVRSPRQPDRPRLAHVLPR